MDSEGYSLFIVETSFNYKFKVSRRVKEKSEETIMQYGNYDVKVTDIYVKGDVLLHGFLLTKTNNSKGVIVYGYGGFRISLLPSFPMSTRLLLDEGYSVLITNLRGGYENGEEWHKAGMLLNKKNVFKDFSEFLRLVKSLGGKTIAMGGSNGGLLVGATENEYPNVIDCAVIGHPVLDMLRYDKLYVGKYWVEEYGDPNDPKYRDYLLSYSPYHNLKKGLPKTFVYTGINDDRVHPAHALKYVAKSEKLGNDVMLFVNDSGHAIADPESEAREYSYVLAFIEECTSSK
jgi:prolyl oligopeptidase